MSEHDDDFGGELGVAKDERPDAAKTFAKLLTICAQEPRREFKYVESGRKMVTHHVRGKGEKAWCESVVDHLYNFMLVKVTRAGESYQDGISVEVKVSWVVDKTMTGQSEPKPDQKPFFFRVLNGKLDQQIGTNWQSVNISHKNWTRETPKGRALAGLLTETLYALFDLEKVVFGTKYAKVRRVDRDKKDGGNGTP